MASRSHRSLSVLVLLSLLTTAACGSRPHTSPTAVPPIRCPAGQSASVTNGTRRDVDLYAVTDPGSLRTLVGTVPALSNATLPLPLSSTHVILWWTGESFPDESNFSGLWASDHIYVRFQCR
ncbi:MAG TPA: hypothetical protein VMT29_17765 [Steroidobacteraceae bacterium]|nr:hypothetical protein [Steroidobacteraceae bacterium]